MKTIFYMIRYWWLAFCLLLVNNLWAQSGTQINNARLWRAPDNTRLVFDLSAAANYKELSLSNPERLVIDVFNAHSFNANLSSLNFANTPIKGVRTAKYNSGHRIVIDLSTAVTPKVFTLNSNQQYGYRLVVDLYDISPLPIIENTQPQHLPSGNSPATTEQNIEAVIAQITTKVDPHTTTKNPQSNAQSSAKKAPVKLLTQADKNKRDIVIVIDAGHGGEDPGAVNSITGVREKNVVLAIAKKLQQEINSYPGFRSELTRTGDYFIPLEKRPEIARSKKAELLVSVHANSTKKGPNYGRAFGTEVYAVSLKGATSESAKWLADSENSSNLIGGVSNINHKDKMLSSVLLDVSMTSSLNSSLNVGQKVLQKIGAINPLHKKKVEQAGFVVLKSPDIPSILVETGFISNINESRKLNTNEHQTKVAKAIAAGVVSFFQQNPPPNTFVAWQRDAGNLPKPKEHIVVAGESLTRIAAKYNVSISQIRSLNKLQSDSLKAGQVLKLP